METTRADEALATGSGTPVLPAHAALSSSQLMCDLLNAARVHGFPGSYSGSAFRCHPCGVIDGTVKLTNHWHVDNHCDIKITDGEGWGGYYCTDSCAHGDPHPHAIKGGEVRAWMNGKWASEEMRAALEPRVSALLDRMTQYVATKQAEKEAAEAQEREQAAARHQALVAAALSKATGASS